MPNRPRSVAALAAALALATPVLRADEVVMKDGTTHVGQTRKVGEEVEIKTIDGVVRVRASEVDWEKTRDDRQLRKDFARLTYGRTPTPLLHLELARTAKGWGLYEEMWQHLGTAVHTLPAGDARYARIRRFMAGLEPVVLPRQWRASKPEVKVQKLLNQFGAKADLARIATVAELLANLPEVDGLLRKEARQARGPVRRLVATRAVMFRAAPERAPDANDRFVFRAAVLDGAPLVRELSMRLAAEHGKATQAVEYMAPMLGHENNAVRVRTAEAFGVLGDPSALPHLAVVRPAAAPKKRGGLLGGSHRAHMTTTEQRSFVRDFDVEIAQAAAVANPQIGVLRSGVVFDVTVIAGKSYPVEVIDAQRKAIRRITGADPGADATKWPEWVKDRQAAGQTGR